MRSSENASALVNLQGEDGQDYTCQLLTGWEPEAKTNSRLTVFRVSGMLEIAMPFFDATQGTVRELFPGVMIRVVWGEKLMLSVVDLEPHAVVPPHSHPHEQMGLLLEGEFDFTIGDETKRLTAGDAWFVPSNVVHSVRATEKGAKALDVFHPVREEYK